MLLWNPLLLRDDLGFQLSFLSVLGILEVSPHLERLLARVPNVLALRESVALTLSSQVAAAPWIAYKLGNLSLVALPANLLAAPLIPWAMLCGALSVLASTVGLGLPVAFAGNVPLSAIIAVARVTASVPYAAIDGLAPPAWAIAAYYLFLAGVLSATSRRSSSSRTAKASSISPTAQLRGVWGDGKTATSPFGSVSAM
jgi:competence protein ComEC